MRLFVVRKNQLVAIHPIEGTMMIGRGGSVDVGLDDPRASRNHAVITCRDGAMFLRDLDSRNGTRLNGRKIDGEVELKAGDEIGVGHSLLYVGQPPHDIRKKYLVRAAPQRLGKFEIKATVGRGGMGEVFRAYDTENDVEVALKIVRDAVADSEEFLKRFHDREATLVRQLTHPNIVETYEDGVIDGQHFLSMEYVSGGRLSDRMRGGGVISTAETLEILRQAAMGLHAAHRQGIIHRDIKPPNILLARSGTILRSRKTETKIEPEIEINDADADEHAAELPDTPLMARAIEVERLAAGLAAARGGQETLLLVRGEQGIGKTRILMDFLRSEHCQDCELFILSRDEGSGSYNPFRGLAQDLIERAEHRREVIPAHTFDRWLEVLSPVLSEAVLKQYGITPSKEGSFRAMAEAFCDVLTILQTEGRCVIVLDDLLWADEMACRMLGFFVPAAAEEGMLICAGLREDARIVNGPLQAAIAQLARRRLASEMYLKPLTRFETMELAAEVLGDRELARNLATNLFRVSKGVPAAVRRALASLLASGALVKTDEGYELNADVTTHFDENLSQMLIDRYGRLPGPVKEVFHACCVDGGWLNFALLKPACSLADDHKLFLALGHLESEGLLIGEKRRNEKFYHVSNDQLREHVEEGLSEKEHSRLHGVLATAIERAASSRPVEETARLAYHLCCRKSHNKAAGVLKEAVELANGAEITATAREYIDRTLVELYHHPPADDGRLLPVKAELKELYAPLARYERMLGSRTSMQSPGEVKVADFGVALMAFETDADETGYSSGMGTPRYMAPEQIRGEPLDGRCDIFSLGVMAFEMLTGRPTFDVEKKSQYLEFNCNKDIPLVSDFEPSVPPEVARIVQRMTARNREARYTAEELIAQIEHVQDTLYLRG